MFTHHQAMFYRRAAMEGLSYDLSYTIAADYKLTAQFLKRTGHVLYAPIPVCAFESGGISQRRAALGRAEQARARRECSLAGPFGSALIRWAQAASHALYVSCPRAHRAVTRWIRR
jgi:putative colanic acid biosynthesis glycosyltransferase